MDGRQVGRGAVGVRRGGGARVGEKLREERGEVGEWRGGEKGEL